MKRVNQKALLKKWENVEIGTWIVVRKDNGEELRTKVRDKPLLLGDHSAVIWLEGISGCYSLERVRLMRPEDEPLKCACGA